METAATVPSSAPELQPELQWLELRLRREVLVARGERGGAGGSDEFAGLYISEEEMDRYLSGGEEAEGEVDAGELDARVARAWEALQARWSASREAGLPLPIEHLGEVFGLGGAERAVLIACLAPELDLRFERYFAYLQNDVSKKRPCVQLLDRLFFGRRRDLDSFRRIAAAEGSLVGMKLLEPVPAQESGLAARELKLCEGVLGFLLGVEASPPELEGAGQWRQARPLERIDGYFGHHRAHLERVLAACERDGCVPRAFLRGPEGCGKEDLVLALADALSGRVLEVEPEELLARSGRLAGWLAVVERELALRMAFLWVRHAERLAELAEAERASVRALGAFLREHPALNVVFTGERGPLELRELLDGPLLELELPSPSLAERVELWRRALGALGEGRPGLAEELSAKFRFGPGRIRSALAAVRSELAAAGAASQAPAELEAAVLRACRAESNPTLGAYAQQLRPAYDWEDLVLPPGVLAQLREIRDSVRHRARVHAEWGFEAKFSLGKGLTVLFAGPSGTGKTMSAEVLARDLGLDVYKIDLSSVVSKYIGETEKNLSRIFREAESHQCILLFDEADALFGKRSEVRDAHDRYANIEVDYLLQRLEEYEGIVILTSNMSKNLDPAFTRRLQYLVEFPAPDERHRELLWRKVFPAATPRADDLDVGFLAKRFKLSGASIKSIALNSAFLAAADGGVVDMGHVVTALRREHRKLGKLVSRSDFGAYGHLVAEDEGGEP